MFWTKFARFKERGKEDTSSRYRDPVDQSSPEWHLQSWYWPHPQSVLPQSVSHYSFFVLAWKILLLSLLEWKPCEGKASLSLAPSPLSLPPVSLQALNKQLLNDEWIHRAGQTTGGRKVLFFFFWKVLFLTQVGSMTKSLEPNSC